MPSRILSNEQVKDFVYDIFENKMFRAQILDKYKMGKSTFSSYMKKAVNLGFITEKKRLNWQNSAPGRSLEARIKKHGLKQANNFCKEGWKKGAGKSQQDLIDHGRLGGDITQALYPYVVKNLKGDNQYKQKKCYYNNIQFSSFGERFLALLLLQYKLIDEIIPGENFQKKIDSKIVDFYINENLIVEYHPILKKHSKIKYKTERGYKENRKNELEDYFNGEIVVVTSISDFFKKLPKLGIKESWHDHVEKVREAKFMLFDYEHNPDNKDSNSE